MTIKHQHPPPPGPPKLYAPFCLCEPHVGESHVLVLLWLTDFTSPRFPGLPEAEGAPASPSSFRLRALPGGPGHILPSVAVGHLSWPHLRAVLSNAATNMGAHWSPCFQFFGDPQRRRDIPESPSLQTSEVALRDPALSRDLN